MNAHNHLIKVIRTFWTNRRDNAAFIPWMEDNGHLTPSPEPPNTPVGSKQLLIYTDDDGSDHVQEHFNAALNFAIDKADGAQDAMDFLVAWREGDWGTLDEHYPDFDLTDSLRNPQP